MKKRGTEKSYFCIRSTPFGQLAVLWSFFKSQPKIFRILLSRPDISAKDRLSLLFPDSKAYSVREIDVVTDNIEESLKGAACVVITADHDEFKELNIEIISRLAQKPLSLVDTRHIVDPIEAGKMGIYLGIGRPRI